MIIHTKSIANLYGKNGLEGSLTKKKADADLINDALCNSDEGRSCALGNASPYSINDIKNVASGKLKLNDTLTLTPEHVRALNNLAFFMENMRIDYVF
jgi:hypothetical protein